jgi:hypothetical protein
MIATLNLGPTDPNNPKEDFTQHFNPARNTAFKEDVKKFVDYLHARYDGDKYFNVLDSFKREADRMVENRKIGWLNQRPPIPEPLASLASLASRFEEARVVLDYINKDGWNLYIYVNGVFGGLHFDEHENPVTHNSRDLIRMTFGEIHEHKCRPIEDLFFVQAEVVTNETGEEEYSGKDYIVSPPFASKPEAEEYLKLLNEGPGKREIVKSFMPPATNIDYVAKAKVIGP